MFCFVFENLIETTFKRKSANGTLRKSKFSSETSWRLKKLLRFKRDAL